tara:strand:- start:443 stop:1090 length:648 start_codon:yes stop_codon:yes gene_type:complete
MKIKSFQGGFDKNITYIIWCELTSIAAIVDASVNMTEIIEYIEINDLLLEKILITHTHSDHINFLEDILFQFPQIEVCGFEFPEYDFGNDYRRLKHYDVITLGTELITCIHTPGHYPDSICYWSESNNYLFTGDTMFVGRTGRTISKKSNINDLYHSIYEIILKLPQNTIIYPGHHYGHALTISIKDNILISPFFQCSDKMEFIKVMKEFEEGRR